MSFLAPLYFEIALAVAAGAVALHFIVTRQPTSSPLPTVRFVPPSQVRVTTVAPRPEDLLLLLVRVLAILLVGAALARPVIAPTRRPVVRVVLADVSRGVGRIETVRDSARALLRAGDALIVFDSAAHVVGRGAADSAGRLVRTEREGNLSAALVAALRAAARVRDAADSIEIDIVSPLRAREVDGATGAIRALWPGRIHIARVAAAADSLAPSERVSVRADSADPVALAVSASGMATGDSAVRVLRTTATAADSAWAAGGRRTLVRWPAGAPPGWITRPHPDTMPAVIAGETALVYPLERRYRLDSAARPTRVAARWVDGAPAAVEYRVGDGCIRDVAIPVPARGDVVLRPSFAHLLRALLAPCDLVAGGVGAPSSVVQAIAGTGALASGRALRAPETVATPLVPWLLGGAVLLLLGELFVRQSTPPWSVPIDRDEHRDEPEAVA